MAASGRRDYGQVGSSGWGKAVSLANAIQAPPGVSGDSLGGAS